MAGFLNTKSRITGGLLVALCGLMSCLFNDRKIDFSAEVKPILNKNCIVCHGGVKAKGDFSLLFREDALAKTKSGKYAIVPGNPGKSEMIRRLTLSDPEERMPYQHQPLSKEEISILTKWIKQGAEWGEHWAYKPLEQIPVPEIQNDWVRNDIDRFVYRKLKAEELQPASRADKATLLRRVSLDLIGMQPDQTWADAFLQSEDASAYERLVDSLLASPHFGERWAALWMDLARYADTKGYERDDFRTIWHYRDWLIRAFNEDKPYDQFLTEQIAGDLLPDPTESQYIATAFHRNTMTNDEGGTDNEEFRTAAVMDRVNTTWEVLMGTTFACVQCHSHPYDPFRHDEYYKFMAFFNDSRDEDTWAEYPLYRHLDAGQQEKMSSVVNWVKAHGSAAEATATKKFIRTWQPAINSLTADQFVNSELNDTKWLIFRNHGTARLRSVDLQDKDQLIFRFIGIREKGTWQLHLDRPDGPVLATVKAPPTKGWAVASIPIEKQQGVHDLYLSYENPLLTNPNESGLQFDWFYFTRSFPGKGNPGYDQEKNQFWDLITANVATTPVMMDNPASMHRNSYVFERGNWLVKGDKVEPAVPASLAAGMPAEAPKNRMGLAMWLTSKQNPLVARTMVNRVWEQLFGTGIAETLEDLGTQGLPPTHRELLDWLSWNYMNDYRWSLKKLLKEMVMSATYCQDSRVTEELKQKDAFNRYLARGPRVRLSAEQIRDQALCISGTLCGELYGPSVYPYQPDGIWLSPWNGAQWKQSADSELYRRALYTFWKRTSPYPSMLLFDGVAREVCTARRIRTNTPLQALAMMNDSVYIDLSRHFAERMLASGSDISKQIQQGYYLMLYKDISPAKLQVLVDLYQQAMQTFEKKKSNVRKDGKGDAWVEENKLAAMTLVANAMLNLDDVITKN